MLSSTRNRTTSFNSIKVQLRRYKAYFDNFYPNRFQFHKGTIKAALQKYVNKDSIIFQFHKGTIKATYQIQNLAIYIAFNSIKVQLRLRMSSLADAAPSSFNSIKVQLRHATSFTDICTFLLSIP